MYFQNAIQPHVRNRMIGERREERVLVCYYCKKSYRHRIRDHLVGKHSNEIEIAAALAKTGKERDNALDLVRNKGNFKHNVAVLSSGQGELILSRRPSTMNKPVDINNYLPCTHCFSFFLKDELWRHVKCYCKFKPEGYGNVRAFGVQAKAILLLDSCVITIDIVDGLQIDPVFKKDILQGMHINDVYNTIVQDPLIIAFGQLLHKKLGKRRHNDIAQRMRQLGRLHCKLVNDDELKQPLSTYLSGKQFDHTIEAVYAVCDYTVNEQDVPIFQKPGLALRLGHNLVKVAQIKRGLAIRQDDNLAEMEAERFLKLKYAEWPDRVSTIALTTLATKNFNEPDMIPLTTDIIKLREYLDTEAKIASKNLESNQSYANWRCLADLVLCSLTIFNKRRGGEVEQLRIVTYENKTDWKNSANKEVLQSLQPMEKELFNR